MKRTARSAALAALRALSRGVSFATSLDDEALAALDPRDRGLARALAFGVARERRLLDALVDERLDRPLTGSARRLRPILALGFFQLGWLRIEDHAAVHATVELVRERAHRGLVNALLRRYQREGAPTALAAAPEAVACSHPAWLVAQLRADWGDLAAAILSGNQQPAPLWIRVDPRRGSVEGWLEALDAAGLGATRGHAPTMLRLTTPAPVEAIPGFGEGRLSVQDGAAQLAAPLVPAVGRGRILDACAAPGGKSLHLRALAPDARLLALDVDADRVERMRANFARCAEPIETRCADAASPARWWNGEPFAAILLDAPCSGTGVIRRHPDIKWLRRAGDVEGLVSTQDRLLDAAWGMLAPGGALVYATCSVLRAENDRRIAAFRARHPEARADALTLPVGRAVGDGWQILPGEGALDGFFYARLVRPVSGVAAT